MCCAQITCAFVATVVGKNWECVMTSWFDSSCKCFYNIDLYSLCWCKKWFSGLQLASFPVYHQLSSLAVWWRAGNEASLQCSRACHGTKVAAVLTNTPVDRLHCTTSHSFAVGSGRWALNWRLHRVCCGGSVEIHGSAGEQQHAGRLGELPTHHVQAVCGAHHPAGVDWFFI